MAYGGESDVSASYRSIANVLGAPIDGGTQTISLTSSSAAVTVTAGKVYRLIATVACHVIFTAGGSAAATTSDCYLEAGVPEFFSTINGGFTRIAAIRNASDGTLYISELG